MQVKTKILLRELISLRDSGEILHSAAKKLGVPQSRAATISSRYSIGGWPQGAAARNQFGQNNPNFKGGISRATLGRKTKEAVILSGRDPFICERCGARREIEYPRHHKDRDKRNNEPSNIEVLCPSCHNIEHEDERDRDTDTGRFIG